MLSDDIDYTYKIEYCDPKSNNVPITVSKIKSKNLRDSQELSF